MMSLEAFKFYYWFMFIWGGMGMLFIAFVSLKEVISQLRDKKKSSENTKTLDV